MKFNKPYERAEFINFLRHEFLPEDFINEEEDLIFSQKTEYSTSAIKIGRCDSLDLIVLEIRHNSINDARVSLSKEAFRLLANELVQRALVIFIPEKDTRNYRFSYIEIELGVDKKGNLIKEYSNPHRYSYLLGEGIAYYTPNKYLNEQGRVIDEIDLKSRFSVEVLTKAFYGELSDWFAWAIKEISFPNDINNPEEDKNKLNHESAIRLITRLIFVWFLKQKHLIPEEFFDVRYIQNHLLKKFDPYVKEDLFFKSKDSVYYKAILQNLFFAMLNNPIMGGSGRSKFERKFKTGRGQFDDNKLMRYKNLFKDPDKFIELANSTVPFLNGGLFDCIDIKDKGLYYDGFSDRKLVQQKLIVPDYLFFGEDRMTVDLSEYYGDENKKQVSARGIIDILKRYNFTVEENTPFDQEVSLDPELLGKAFENLLAAYNPETKQTARKETGSFYTPRSIVQFMVDESLVEYLKRKVGVELEEKYRSLLKYSDEDVNLTDSQCKNIMKALYDCNILDPACGSGAFPMGILQQMVHILNRIDPKNEAWMDMIMEMSLESLNETEVQEVKDDIERSFDESINRPNYARKLYLIENCIYGVDIQPIAIQISKLRFFISLVVDQKTNNDANDNFGIRPLPNLESKFIAADSLAKLKQVNQDGTYQMSLFDDSPKISKYKTALKDANHKIFCAKTKKTKRKYQELIKELRGKIAEELKSYNVVSTEEANMLAKWDMFNQNLVASFFDPEWMFGVKEGFDIIIGNPPYVQLQNEKGKLAKRYSSFNYETFVRTGDIYCLFYEQCYNLLVDSGLLCFITSNKWMRAGYGKKLRDFLGSRINPILLVDFAGIKIFESATVDTNILIYAKEQNKMSTKCVVMDKEDSDCLCKLSDFVQSNNCVNKFDNSDIWIVLSPIEQSIKNKIESIGTPLKNWDITINYGIKTGCNEAFIISTEKREEILSNCHDDEERKRTEDLIRPILRGRDIKRYSYEWAGLYLIATFPVRHYDIEHYPAVKKHLLEFGINRLEQTGKKYTINGKVIKARKKTNHKWFELQDSIAYWEDFDKPKIIYPNMTKYLPFVFDIKQFLTNQKCFIITGNNIAYLTAFLNSSLFKFCYRDKFPELQGGTRELSKIFFEHIFVKEVTKEKNTEFELLVNKIQKKHSINLAKTLDSMIFKLYGLSEDEIKQIGFIEIK